MSDIVNMFIKNLKDFDRYQFEREHLEKYFHDKIAVNYTLVFETINTDNKYVANIVVDSQTHQFELTYTSNIIMDYNDYNVQINKVVNLESGVEEELDERQLHWFELNALSLMLQWYGSELNNEDLSHNIVDILMDKHEVVFLKEEFKSKTIYKLPIKDKVITLTYYIVNQKLIIDFKEFGEEFAKLEFSEEEIDRYLSYLLILIENSNNDYMSENFTIFNLGNITYKEYLTVYREKLIENYSKFDELSFINEYIVEDFDTNFYPSNTFKFNTNKLPEVTLVVEKYIESNNFSITLTFLKSEYYLTLSTIYDVLELIEKLHKEVFKDHN